MFAAGVVGRAALGSGKVNPARDMPATGFSERANRDVQIRVWHQALDADSLSAIALGQLAALHLQRAREGGSWSDYLDAERYARRSLALRISRNGSTASTLANVLMAQHRFGEAQYVAAQLVRNEPDVPEYRALLGEASMELGDYSLAGRMFDSLWSSRTHLTIAARLSRWAELHGNTNLGRQIIDAARATALARRDIPKETKAWYELRAGEMAIRAGRARTARKHFEAGLAIEPGDPRLAAALARLSLSQNDFRGAIRWAGRAIAVQLEPEMLGILGDAYTGLRETERAAEFYSAMDVSIKAVEGPFHRAWMMQYLDRGVRVQEMLERARADYANRKDVYGCDVYAWALFKAGQDREAQRVMREALRLGTSDPLLLGHAVRMGLVEE